MCACDENTCLQQCVLYIVYLYQERVKQLQIMFETYKRPEGKQLNIRVLNLVLCDLAHVHKGKTLTRACVCVCVPCVRLRIFFKLFTSFD